MQEHPVPQNITSYEFRLIGNMTLKQFFELCAGLLLGFLTYTSNLPSILKIPLMAFFGLFGAALAFLPVEERPLDQWFIAFLQAIYNPTKFRWQKTTDAPEIFTPTKKHEQPKIEYSKDFNSSEKRYRAKAFLQSMKTDSAVQDELQEKSSNLLAMFNSSDSAKTSSPPKFSAGTRLSQPVVSIRPQQVQMQPQTLSGTIHVPTPKVTKPDALTPDKQFQSEHLVKNRGEVVVLKTKPSPLTVSHTASQENASPEISQTMQQYHATNAAIPLSAKVSADSIQDSVKTNASLPFPKTPSVPNLVVGMVLDPEKKILEGAIVEIQNSAGMTVRALKTNMLGQFFATTPLDKGEYILIAEKDGLIFEPQKLMASNKIIEPLEISASSRA